MAMPGKLLWSWTMADTKAALNQYELPKWVETSVGFVGLGAMLYATVKYISPITGAWITVAAALIAALGLYSLFSKKESTLSIDDGRYLKLYNDGIAVNIDAYYGFYKADDIDLESLAVKYILAGTNFGFGPVKGLYFKTKNPAMTVKIPLIGLLKGRIEELEGFVYALKNANPPT